MCVIEEKTHRQADGSVRTERVLSPCHRYIAKDSCNFTEYRGAGSGNETPRLVEIRPSTSTSGRPSSSSSSIGERVERILVDDKGRQRRYVNVVRRSAKTGSSSRSPVGGNSPAPPSPQSILKRTHARNVSDSEGSGVSSTGYSTRIVEPSSAGSGARPSSMGSSADLFDAPHSRRSSAQYESTVGTVDDDGYLQPPRRTPSVRVTHDPTSNTTRVGRRPPPIDAGAESSRGHLRADSGSDLPARASTKGKERAREVRFGAADDPAESERQAQLERERLAGTDRRQHGREQRTAAEREATTAERIRDAEAHQRRSVEEAAAEALRRGQRNADQSRRADLEYHEQREEARRQDQIRTRAEQELDQMRREREETERRQRGESFYGDSPLSSPSVSHTIPVARPGMLPVPPPAVSYHGSQPTSPVGSYASPRMSARYPSSSTTTTVQTVVHNPDRPGRSGVYQRGARVLEEEQQRGAAGMQREMAAAMAEMQQFDYDAAGGPAEANQGRRRDQRPQQYHR